MFGLFWKWLAWTLRSWADYAHVELDRERRHEIASLKSRLAISEAEVKRLGLLHVRWCETISADTAAQTARRALAEAVHETSGRGE